MDADDRALARGRLALHVVLQQPALGVVLDERRLDEPVRAEPSRELVRQQAPQVVAGRDAHRLDVDVLRPRLALEAHRVQHPPEHPRDRAQVRVRRPLLGQRDLLVGREVVRLAATDPRQRAHRLRGLGRGLRHRFARGDRVDDHARRALLVHQLREVRLRGLHVAQRALDLALGAVLHLTEIGDLLARALAQPLEHLLGRLLKVLLDLHLLAARDVLAQRLGRHRLELGHAHDRPVQRLQFVVARVRAQLTEAGAVDRGLHDLAVEAVRRARLVAREDLGFVPPERCASEVAHGLGEGLPLVALRARRAVLVRALVLDRRVLARGVLEALGLSARVADDVVPQRVRRERRLRQIGGLRRRQQPAHALAGSREVHRHRVTS